VASPKHHVGLEALFDFGSGSVDQGLGLAIACHLAFCAQCRATLDEIESLTEMALACAAAATRGLPQVRDRLFDRLTHEPTPLPVRPRVDARLSALGLPQVLSRVLPPEPVNLSFRRLLPGIEVIDLTLTSSAPNLRARLMRFRPGVSIPTHDHEGDEHAVVLRGSFQDDGAQFGPGDVCITHPGAPHQLRVDPGELCITLVVNHGRIIPHTLLGKVLALVCGM
jgi:putative transcriptional regulator